MKVFGVGEICTSSKDKDKKYIKVKRDFTAKAGTSIDLVTFQDNLKTLVSKGIIDQEKADSQLEKVTWVSYVLNAPKNEEEVDCDRSDWINEAIEIRTNKDGQLYIQVMKDLDLKEGDYINLKSFEDSINELHKKGFIEDKDLAKRLEPADWLHYYGTVPPPR